MIHPVSIITGAGGGIGRAIAAELARLGHRLVLVGRTEQTLLETAKAIQTEHLVIPADVTSFEQVQRVVTTTLAQFGRIDVVINNAGIAPVLPIEKTSLQAWHSVMDTNVSAAFYLCQAAWPTFRKQNGGVVVNISSMAARDPFPGFLAYGAAKAALNNLGISLSREGAPIGVRVHTLALGAVETPMLRSVVSTEQFPTANTLSPDEVAKVVGECVAGTSGHASGDVIWLSK